MLGMKPKDRVIRQEYLDLQVKWNRANEKSLIANVASESSDSHFGKVTINARLETEQRMKSEQKREKIELQTLKMQIESSVKKNKVFNISIPVNRGVKKSADSKIHFLLELSDTKGLLTFVDDYAECNMTVKGKAHQLSFSEAIELQKRKQDRRRKKSFDDEIPPERHNDRDFEGADDDDNE